MAYKKMEQQLTEAIRDLEGYFKQTRSIDVYEGLETRTDQINKAVPRKDIKFPGWITALSGDERQAVDYMWRIEAARRGYFGSSDGLRVDKIFVAQVNHEIIAFAKLMRNPH